MKLTAGDDAATDGPGQDRTDAQPSKTARDSRGADGIPEDDGGCAVPDVQIQRWKNEGGAWIRPD